jgi:hypothetical protein
MATANTPNKFEQGLTVSQSNDLDFYTAPIQNWLTAQPYGFRFTFADDRFGAKIITMFLPISPSNLTISTNFGTNIVPTLFGTVEEHTDVRYFDIQIEGTTGFAPKWVSPQKFGLNALRDGSEGSGASVTYTGRKSFAVDKAISLGGFFAKTLGAISAIKNKAAEAANGSNIENTPGVYADQTGYRAFHELYKMLLRYKREASTGGQIGVERQHPLVFFNYKDGNQYNVVIRNFTMRRSAENPMLYYYSISMRGYRLSSLKEIPQSSMGNRLEELGLNGVSGSSVLGEIKKRANSVKGVVAAAVGGINILGR